MKKTVFLIVVLIVSTFAFAQFNDLLFSEYIEGSSYNKALEIYNGTGADVDLSDYVLLQAANGGNYDEYSFWMSGILADGDVYIIAHGSADQAILDQTDYIDNYIANFNGDDFRGLGKLDPEGIYPTTGPTEEPVMISIVDMIGMYPDDPGDYWAVAGVDNGTQNHTLVRKPEVIEGIHGNDEWPLAAGTNADDSQWILYESNTFDYIGWHITPPVEDPAIEVTMPNGGEMWYVGETYMITWNNTMFTENVDIYLNLPVRFDIATDIANTGSFEWMVPVDVPISSEIMMVVEDAVDADPMDMSDAFFTIMEMSAEVPEIVINEIMYNPATALGSDSYYEFLELYNAGTEAADMTGCYFPEGMDYAFEDGAMIDAGAYVVLAVDPDSFFVAFGFEPYAVFDGALGNSGEDIQLVTADSTEIDFVDYDDGGDWPSSPDGSGSSLELISPELDNSLAENWQGSYVDNGTPGAANSIPISSIGWGNLQWPLGTQIVVGDTTETIYGKVWMDGVTSEPGQGMGITAQVGYGADESTPGEDWTWIDAIYNADDEANDEYMGNLSGMEEGLYDYTYRYIYEGDDIYYYAGEIGDLTVVATPPEEVNVTFAVDMQYQEVSADGVHIAGSFQGWDPAATMLTDDNMDNVYEVTITLLSGTTQEFKYVNGSAWEDLSNRTLTVPEADSVLVTVLFNDWFPVESGMFFSEYIEGSSNNKAMEIYNGTEGTVNLDNYRIAQAVNGGGWAYYHIFPEGATLEAEDVWVICTDQVSADYFDLANADEVLGYPSVVHYNGDDARALEYTINGVNWAQIDLIGDPNTDPGDGWEVAGVATATKEHTLVRKGFVTAGNMDWLIAAGTNADDGEWAVYDQNTFDYLGFHGEAPELTVTFNVNMNYQIMLGNFDSTVNFVDIAGNFNEWGAVAMLAEDLDEDGIYSVTAMLPLGYNCEFKFRIDGNWDLAEFPGGGNRTYTVIDGENVLDLWFSDEEIPAFTTQDVTVTFALNMEYVDPMEYAGGISIQGSVAPLGWDPGVNLLVPVRENHTIDILFPAGSIYDVEFKFAMMADGADWVWESVDNRMFTIDDANATQMIPEVLWNNMMMLTIPEIQTPVDTTDASPYIDQIVSTQGIVTAVTSNKYWIGTPEGGAYSGMYIYDPVNMPVLGECIMITGTVSEYYNLTEMFDITGYEVMSSGNPLPDPVMLTTAQLSAEEQWESVFVMVEGVTVTGATSSYGEWFVDDSSGACMVDDGIYYVDAVVGDEYASITGVVGFSYDVFRLFPRFEEDLSTGPEWIYGDVTGDWLVDAFDAANMLQYAVMLDPIGAPLPWTWQLISGDVDGNGDVEAYDAALVLQYSVDLIEIFPVEVVRNAVNPQAGINISVEGNTLVFAAEGEFYSSVINVNTDLITIGTPEFMTDALNVTNSEEFAVAVASALPLNGSIVSLPYEALAVEGSFTVNMIINGISSEREINMQDLETGNVITVNEVLGNYPNPFNPVTNIKLAIADDATSVKVAIYNIKGQLVKNLFNDQLNTGIHSLTWNGTDNSGKTAGSGVYFYRSQIAGVSSMNKMLMLK